MRIVGFTGGVDTHADNGTWRKKTVALMLAQPAYKGTYSRTVDGRLFTFDVEPIITEDIWDAAQAMPKAPAKVRDAGTKKRHYGLSGRIFHLHDNGTSAKMFGRAQKTKRIYRC